MKAAFYTKVGKARNVLQVGETEEILPEEGEVQIEMYYSGVNPGDIKKRNDTFKRGMPFPKIIPHSDGAGVVRQVGKGVEEDWLGKKVMCFGAQSNRPAGTAAEYCCVPVDQVVEISDKVPMEQAAQMGIPGITAYRAVNLVENIKKKSILIHGGGGSVGQCAVALAGRADATVLATVTNEAEMQEARDAGAEHVFINNVDLVESISNFFPIGIDHIIEVAFSANIKKNVALLKNMGSIACYATNKPVADFQVWPLIFKNVSIYFIGSDNFPADVRQKGAKAILKALENGWRGLPIGQLFELDDIAKAHEYVEDPKNKGRALLRIKAEEETPSAED